MVNIKFTFNSAITTDKFITEVLKLSGRTLPQLIVCGIKAYVVFRTNNKYLQDYLHS